MKNENYIAMLKADIIYLQAKYQKSTGREVYRIGAQLRDKRKQLETELAK